MRCFTRPITLGLLLSLGGSLLAALPAHAQSSSPLDGNGARPVVGNGPQAAKPQEAPSAALPGSRTGADRVIPAEHATSDMSPTDALFDAVNRGDITAARDSIARGADFNARNELGLTPLDESIDLGRNNITFLLLSLRGGSSDSAPPPPDLTASRAAPPRLSTAPAPRPAIAPPAAVHPVAAAAKPSPAPVASNPGTPSPKNGFLGFGG